MAGADGVGVARAAVGGIVPRWARVVLLESLVYLAMMSACVAV